MDSVRTATDATSGTGTPGAYPDPRPNAPAPSPAVSPSAPGGPSGHSTEVPAIERDASAAELEPAEPHGSAGAPLPVSAEVPEDIEASIDFSEVELADEFAEPEMAVTPGGLLPMEPSPIEGRLRKAPLRVPDELEECGGFTLFGRRIKSLLYTTDVAVIRNSNADAIFAVYPFTAQPAITQALLTASDRL